MRHFDNERHLWSLAGVIGGRSGAALFALCAGLFALLAFAAHDARAMEWGVDRPGNDYRSFNLSTPNPNLCRSQCAAEGQCVAWTYVNPGVQGPQARCWLKAAVPNPVQNNCCVSGVKQAAAPNPQSQTFNRPRIGGNRLDWCREWAQNCGKPAADAFCRQAGFQRSSNFSQEADIGASQPTQVIGTGQICNQNFCDGFRRITCVRSASGNRTFNNPRISGNRLDWCREWAQNCGKPAADAFCRVKGYSRAVNFAKAPNVGASQPTQIITSGQICNQAGCDGFSAITCAP